MASVAAISSLSSSICTAASERIPISTSLTSSLSFLRFDRRNTTFFLPNCCLYLANKKKNDLPIRIRAVAEETLASEEEGETKEEATSDQTVSVPVSSSDVLTMFFQAEGTMTELAVGNVRKALEGVEDVSDLKVQVLEGIASVELKKQTTVQATGVASNLVEVIQGSGFKLQTLNLSFEDEEDVII